jgi:uncharacterized protein (DUF2236 family)
VCWRVHADFTSMLVGGVSALFLQSLHPLALAGVWDHSNFRADILGRLRRTASFITGTTFGSRRVADELIVRVQHIHKRVVGVAPDGRSYSANDPTLLTWVHLAEMDSFLRAYLRYVDADMTGAEQDRYFDEVALIAERLGARDVPRSRRQVQEYFLDIRPQLAYTERTRVVSRVLLDAPAPNPAFMPVGKMFIHAGVDLLPGWAQGLMGFNYGAEIRRAITRPGVHAIAPVMRWGVRRSAARVARERAQAVPVL